MTKRLAPKTAGRSERQKPAISARSEPEPAPRLFDWRTFDPSMIPADGRYSFANEFTTYRDCLDELLEHEGEYVVIKGSEVIGFYAERIRALYEAARRFGEEPVLVKQVAAMEPISVLGHTLD